MGAAKTNVNNDGPRVLVPVVVGATLIFFLAFASFVGWDQWSRTTRDARETATAWKLGYEAGIRSNQSSVSERPPDSDRVEDWKTGFEAGLAESLRRKAETAARIVRQKLDQKAEEERIARVAAGRQQQLARLRELRTAYDTAMGILKERDFHYVHPDARDWLRYQRENSKSSDRLTVNFGHAWLVKIERDTAREEFQRVLREHLSRYNITSESEWYTLKMLITDSLANVDQSAELAPFKEKFGLTDESVGGK